MGEIINFKKCQRKFDKIMSQLNDCHPFVYCEAKRGRGIRTPRCRTNYFCAQNGGQNCISNCVSNCIPNCVQSCAQNCVQNCTQKCVQNCVPNCTRSPCNGKCCMPYCNGTSDDEENFIESIMPFIRCLPVIKKMELKTAFLNNFYGLMQESQYEVPIPVFPPYRPSKPICCQDDDEIFYWGLIPHIKSLPPETRLKARISFFDHLYNVYQDIPDIRIGDYNRNNLRLLDKLKQYNLNYDDEDSPSIPRELEYGDTYESPDEDDPRFPQPKISEYQAKFTDKTPRSRTRSPRDRISGYRKGFSGDRGPKYDSAGPDYHEPGYRSRSVDSNTTGYRNESPGFSGFRNKYKTPNSRTPGYSNSTSGDDRSVRYKSTLQGGQTPDNKMISTDSKNPRDKYETSSNGTPGYSNRTSDDDKSVGYKPRLQDAKTRDYKRLYADSKSPGDKYETSSNGTPGYGNRTSGDDKSVGYKPRLQDAKTRDYKRLYADSKSPGDKYETSSNRTPGYGNRTSGDKDFGYKSGLQGAKTLDYKKISPDSKGPGDKFAVRNNMKVDYKNRPHGDKSRGYKSGEPDFQRLRRKNRDPNDRGLVETGTGNDFIDSDTFNSDDPGQYKSSAPPSQRDKNEFGYDQKFNDPITQVTTDKLRESSRRADHSPDNNATKEPTAKKFVDQQSQTDISTKVTVTKTYSTTRGRLRGDMSNVGGAASSLSLQRLPTASPVSLAAPSGLSLRGQIAPSSVSLRGFSGPSVPSVTSVSDYKFQEIPSEGYEERPLVTEENYTTVEDTGKVKTTKTVTATMSRQRLGRPIKSALSLV